MRIYFLCTLMMINIAFMSNVFGAEEKKQTDFNSLPVDVHSYLTQFFELNDLLTFRNICQKSARAVIRNVSYQSMLDFFDNNKNPLLRFSPYEPGSYKMTFEDVKKTIHIKEAFEMSDHITQEQFVDIMGFNPSEFPAEENHCGMKDGNPVQEIELYKGIRICRGWPVTNTTMMEKQEFVSRLNKISVIQGSPYHYDLPFEEEEAYVQVGGKNKILQKVYVLGKDYDEGPGSIHQLELKDHALKIEGVRNPLGLVDTQTRTHESKEFNQEKEEIFSRLEHEKKYGEKGKIDYGKKGAQSGWVVRGASWDEDPDYVDVDDRFGSKANNRSKWAGFRLLRTRSLNEVNGIKSLSAARGTKTLSSQP